MTKKVEKKGEIFVVATPIGNLSDFSPRAQEILSQVDLIAAEDTRHSQKLLNFFNISTPLTAYHEHNEVEKGQQLLEKLKQGQNLALISDAGTPLISDPGFRLIQMAQEADYVVKAVPGPCAAIAALSIAGLPCDRFLFSGFLPAKSSSRQTEIQTYATADLTVIFYESSHRILASLQDFVKVLPGRTMVIARELTKTFETVLRGSAEDLLSQVEQDENQQKGEFVILLAPAEKHNQESYEVTLETLLKALLAEMPLKKAVKLAVELTQARKNYVYQLALQLTSYQG